MLKQIWRSTAGVPAESAEPKGCVLALRKKKMTFLNVIRSLSVRVRRLVGPRYHPERHYMRGYGPACAARAAGGL